MLRMRRYAIGVAAALLLAQPVCIAGWRYCAPIHNRRSWNDLMAWCRSVTGVNAAGQVSGFVVDPTHG